MLKLRKIRGIISKTNWWKHLMNSLLGASIEINGIVISLTQKFKPYTWDVKLISPLSTYLHISFAIHTLAIGFSCFKHLFLLLDRFVSIRLFLFYFQKVRPLFSPIMFYSVILLAMSTLSDCRYWTWVDLDCEVDLIKSFPESAHISLKLASVPWYVIT